MKNKMVKYPLILGTIALVAGLLLALVYNVTAPVIEANKVKRENAIVIEMFGDDAKIEDISDTLKKEEKDLGIYSALKVKDGSKNYYVYKITTLDKHDQGVNSFVLAVDSYAKIYKVRFVEVADDWGKKYANDSYINGIIGDNQLSDSDIKSGATKTGQPIIESINAALAHTGRVK